jgi:ABC-2 type transport system permease protein
MTSIAAARRSTSAPSSLRLSAVLALIRRDYLIRTSYRLVLVLDFFIGVLDVVVFYFISQTFKDGATASLGTAPSYFAFALVGIAVTAVIQATSSGISVAIRDEQLTGTLEALVTQPLSAIEMAIGMCGIPFLLATFRVGLYLIVGGALLGVSFEHADWAGLVLVLIATGTAMSSIGIVTAAAVMVIKRGQSFSALIIFGMGFLGGAFFPVSVLPGWLEPLASIVPPRYAFDGLRKALYEGGGWWGDALVLLAFSAVMVPVAIWLFERALHHGRRAGSLAQY